MRTMLEDVTFRNSLKLSLAVLLVVGAVWVGLHVWIILEALLVSGILATALWPWVSRISNARLLNTNARMPRAAAAGIIYLLTFSAAAGILWIAFSEIVPQLDRIIAAFPEQTGFLRQYLEPFRSGDIGAGVTQIAGEAARQATDPQTVQATGPEGPTPVNVGELAFSLMGGVISLVMVLIFTFFLLLEGDHFAQFLLLALPRERRLHARVLGLQIRDRVSQWVFAHGLYAITIGVICALAMFLLQIPQPLTYGVGGFALAFLPGVGPAIIAIPAFFVPLEMQAWQPVGVAIFGLALYILDATLVGPKIHGTIMRLPTLVIIIVVLIGFEIAGFWGALLAPPFAAAVRLVLRDFLGREPDPGLPRMT